jgi:NAD-dependent SIR2 family protein deacetylase
MQNVDGLHQKALRQKADSVWTSTRVQNAVLELHGTLHVSYILDTCKSPNV